MCRGLATEAGAPKPAASSNTPLLAAAVGVAFAGAGYLYLTKDGATLAQEAKELKGKVVPEIRRALGEGDKFHSFKLREVHPISHNTSLYRFELPEPDMVLGMDVASCILTKFVEPAATPEGKRKVVIRPYTPTSLEETPGHFDLIVKEYPEGIMSKHIASLKPGDTLDIKGPITKFKYVPNMHKELGMVAGGTGIAPMLQIIRKIFHNPEDQTKVKLIFANVTEDDILLRKELDELAQLNPGRFHVYYTLDKPSTGWTQGTGFVSKEMAQANLPRPSGEAKDTMVYVCGPPPMMKAISGPKASITDQGTVSGILKELGYTESDVFKF
ncbi:NADH-cytochrome b5 reductase 2 [Dimargaris cristalligena]|uniref:NADH-cytochrome b5 reductase n=1 Tax=Dimargaris cristalligena TaxID=215637 RepID=A0A4Q0A283_9FUNG|nr:NADH-cytochrome b5 reductase 2 [Dimargaris cristalligena]|eukprot:RKP39432.1 NADH-cytochrome b5 reductase 2 [Dimargaris cristalligena]